MTRNFAIRFEPDGYVTTGVTLMGRHAAGAGFLRAAVQGLRDLPLNCYSPHRASYSVFTSLVHGIVPSARTEWIPADKLDAIARLGALYLPGPNVAEAAHHRLRLSPDAYSILGVTHTTASHSAMDMIADLITGPVMPWDALICTSSAVLQTVRTILAHEREYLQDRFNVRISSPEPQLPVIPLGVHCDQFQFSASERQAARDSLNIPADAVVILFVGRLSFHAKAHPHPLYVAAEEVARSSGQPLVLLQCGWFANDAIRDAFVKGAADFAPSVRSLFADGRIPEQLRRSWLAADIFVSLSDNIQETFGLTPLEAMAAGLPVIVTDWDGYRETVRDGEHGFRIPTWMPPPTAGATLAARYEVGAESYDRYCGLSAQHVSLDRAVLRSALHQLVVEPETRRALGAAGQAHTRQHYSWEVIYVHYQALLTELATRRVAYKNSSIERCVKNSSPRRLDPYLTFGHYATHQVTRDTDVRWGPLEFMQSFKDLATHPLWRATRDDLPDPALVTKLLQIGNCSVAVLADSSGIPIPAVIGAVTSLAKMGLLRLMSAQPPYHPKG